jgi:hypothetical protein
MVRERREFIAIVLVVDLEVHAKKKTAKYRLIVITIHHTHLRMIFPGANPVKSFESMLCSPTFYRILLLLAHAILHYLSGV